MAEGEVYKDKKANALGEKLVADLSAIKTASEEERPYLEKAIFEGIRDIAELSKHKYYKGSIPEEMTKNVVHESAVDLTMNLLVSDKPRQILNFVPYIVGMVHGKLRQAFSERYKKHKQGISLEEVLENVVQGVESDENYLFRSRVENPYEVIEKHESVMEVVSDIKTNLKSNPRTHSGWRYFVYPVIHALKNKTKDPFKPIESDRGLYYFLKILVEDMRKEVRKLHIR